MKKNILNNSAGFTLIELSLAMTLFITVMVIATTGFIGINRTFTKGLVRKQLSEQTQVTIEDITNEMRSAGGSLLPEPANNQNNLCSSAYCYYWGSEVEPNDGLVKVPNGEDARTSPNRVILLDKRFTVDFIETNKVGGKDNLYRVRAVLKTSDPDAFQYVSEGSDDPKADYISSHDVTKIFCAGSSNNAARTCGLEKVDFVVSTTANQPKGGN